MDILEHITVPALLEQCAEECAELGHACLKLARIIRGENPTPKLKSVALDNLTEEAADVELMIGMLIRAEVLTPDEVYPIMREKEKRWERRIENLENFKNSMKKGE